MSRLAPHVPERQGTRLAWLGGTLAVALLVRLVLWLTYSPVPYSDTASYRRLAEAVLAGFARYDGTRTPGYPIFLALVGGDERVWVVQMALGVLISLLLFYLGRQLSGRSWFGALLALAHTLNLGQLFFEANLLTETLTTFYLAATFAGVHLLQRQNEHPRWALSALTGVAVSLALLTRPLFVYLPVWVVLILFCGGAVRKGKNQGAKDAGAGLRPALTTNNGAKADNSSIGTASTRPFSWKTFLVRLISFSIPAVLLVGGWVLFIHQRFGDWGLTTMTGYHLVQHTGAYFEYVPDEYAALREIYLRHRDAQIAANGTQTNAIWEAIPEMSQATGLNFYDLSDTLANISVRLILEHPGLYLQNVAQGWWMFWRAPVYWSPEALQTPALAGVLSSLISIQRPLLWAVNGIFIFSSLLWAGICYIPARLIDRLPAWIRRLRTAFHSQDNSPRAQSTHRWMLFLAGSIWIASILQSLLDHGDNPRFLVPLQSWVVLWVAWFCYTCWRSFFIERETAHEK